ncbi:hypothetical protein NKT34_18225 [Paenibacillus polysaccharolyticus]|uniref:hypothetical protein n=1 Tax=Paenibacillus polysaccharolyticus TaxID=582692 RepID=UPI00209CCC9F|nr:hypothetical protein [Paenibacillus polysaccharolyticus]MCP1135240.1 hypothetical protein [Paenibacillus polysaccharolyticus]
MTNDFQMPKDIHTIIPSQYRGYEFEKDKAIFEIIMSDYVKRLRSQYLLIERELIKTFEYVEPNIGNYETISIRFASIIRESCNLFELVCKEIYYKLFEYKKRLNIKDFLELDKYLYFKEMVVYLQ